MHLPTHLAISWLLGHRLETRRDRVWVAWSGVVADLDALTALAGVDVYGRWHHVLTHGALFAAVWTAIVFAFARARHKAALLALAAFHLHLLCDLLGSGREWPIVYFYPFSAREYFTPYGWPLASWQNVSITVAALIAIGVIGTARGRTFAEAWLPLRADLAIVHALRARFLPGLSDRGPEGPH